MATRGPLSRIADGHGEGVFGGSIRRSRNRRRRAARQFPSFGVAGRPFPGDTEFRRGTGMRLDGDGKRARVPRRQPTVYTHRARLERGFVLAGGGIRPRVRLRTGGGGMSFGLGKMVEEAENLLDQGRILPALELMKQARGMARGPFGKFFLRFNIGVVYWDKLGDGRAARNELLAAANFEGPELDAPAAREMQAGALENLMLSALSFEEFDNFTARLKAFAPEMPVVSGLPPAIAQMRDYGAPWSTALIQQMAMMNYNRNNPAQDRARYGVAKSTYHILLATRKQQRLSREDWRLVVFEYCALAMRMTNDCQIRRGGDDDNTP